MVDDAFWMRYLRAHADPRTRLLHFAGTSLATGVLAASVVKRDWRCVATALVCGYGPAWFSHAFIERNRPETFSAPLRSLASDYRMWWGALTGTLAADLERAGVPIAEPAPATNRN
jgi:hypothetical protein